MMAKDKRMSRREFIHYSATGFAAASATGIAAASADGSAAASETGSGATSAAGSVPGGLSSGAPSGMPTRTLGGTGLEVSLLSFGGGSQFLANEDGDWEGMMGRALEAGVNYFDTSSSYQYGSPISSEERFGEVLSPIRNQVIIATKFDSREPAEAMREVERSLQRMKTDYLDVLLIHALAPSDDVLALERGVYGELRRLKEEGTVRFIGFSSMDSAERSREAIEKLDFDVALLAMNPTGYGGFVSQALPAAREKNVGVLAMKVMRDIVGTAATPEELLRWALSQEGVATALIGHHGLATLEENLRIIQTIGLETGPEMASVERRNLEGRLAHLDGPHALCWARPDYVDGMAC